MHPGWKASGDCAYRSDDSFIVLDGFAQMRSENSGAWVTCTAADVFERVASQGLDALQGLKGRFNAAVWQATKRRLLLFNDPVGHRIVFCSHYKDRFLFGSNLHFIVHARDSEPVVSLSGLFELLNYGFILGTDTLFEGIHVLPPGSVKVFEGGELTQRTYWHTNQVAVERRYDSDLIDELSERLVAALEQPVAQHGDDIAISLTGGLDSRCLYAAAKKTNPAITAHTAGQQDSTDVAIARKIAALGNGKHVFEPITPDTLSGWLAPMVYFQGALMATLHCHPCQLLCNDLLARNLVQGVGGEFCRGTTWVDTADLKRRVDPGFVESKLFTSNARKLDASRLWVGKLAEEQKSTRFARLDSVINAYDNGDQRLSVLKTIELYDESRKLLNKSSMIVCANREMYYPYFDFDWVQLVASIPIAERLRNNLQVDVLGRLDSALADMVYAKTLLPLSAPPSRVLLSKRYRNILGKIGRKLGKVPTGAIPNHNYRHWIRNEMNRAIGDIVLRKNANYAQYLDRRFIENVFDDHMRGKKNWERLLSAIVVFELACMLWIEKDETVVQSLTLPANTAHV